MSKPSESLELRQLVDDMAQRLGFHAEAGDRDRLALAIGERMHILGIRETEQYQRRLALPEGAAAELRAVADALIIGETYFFRGADHLNVLRQALLEGPQARRWRVLSAGCSSGEEPYSIAMMADQLGLLDRVAIDAVDVNPRALERAALGHYSAWSLRDTDGAARAQYFRQDGRRYLLSERIRSQVQFAECNLLDADHRLWQSAPYDAIFCRNVLIYFAPRVVENVVKNLTSLLREDGFLFLGHAEALQAACADIEMQSDETTVYYRKRSGTQVRAWQPDWAALVAGVQDALDPPLERPAPSSEWQLALSELPADAPVQSALAVSNANHDLHALEFLLRQERWSEAEQALRALDRADLRSQVLLAQLCFVNNRIDEAQQRCERLLTEFFLDAEVHQLMAMCMEQRGRPALAFEHARRASYLDPKFALPHVLLGRLALKAGQKSAALQEFLTAKQRLPDEQTQRLRLLSGGFGRQAMIEYCETQIRVCRGLR